MTTPEPTIAEQIGEQDIQDFLEGYHPDSTSYRMAAELKALRSSVEALQRDAALGWAEILRRQRAFSEKAFGPGDRHKGVCDHIRKELVEIENDPADLMEWIDVAMLALDGAWRAGYTPKQIIGAYIAKLTKNENRTWPDWRTVPKDKAIEHDRSADTAIAASSGEPP
jgi:hypothetical protein